MLVQSRGLRFGPYKAQGPGVLCFAAWKQHSPQDWLHALRLGEDVLFYRPEVHLGHRRLVLISASVQIVHTIQRSPVLGAPWFDGY
jgi:hypothetical protein